MICDGGTAKILLACFSISYISMVLPEPEGPDKSIEDGVGIFRSASSLSMVIICCEGKMGCHENIII